ncbi:MAG: hypothetical protein KAH99_06955 [Verrucomicrobia bacterium]|nr:hypothetical protein [Verrucomicrobiota bacterium]
MENLFLRSPSRHIGAGDGSAGFCRWRHGTILLRMAIKASLKLKFI